MLLWQLLENARTFNQANNKWGLSFNLSSSLSAFFTVLKEVSPRIPTLLNKWMKREILFNASVSSLVYSNFLLHSRGFLTSCWDRPNFPKIHWLASLIYTQKAYRAVMHRQMLLLIASWNWMWYPPDSATLNKINEAWSDSHFNIEACTI